MKKIFFFVLLSMCMGLQAADRDDSKYLAGAVPEVNGVVTFVKQFKVPRQTDQQIRSTLMGFVRDSLVNNAIEGLRTRVISDGSDGGSICARIEEMMVFKSKPLYLDRTRFRYQTTINVTNGKATVEISQISYCYGEEAEGGKTETYKAEEWISDAAAINKAGTKLYPRSGKFRRKTVDRVQEIFEQAISTFETKAEKPVEKPKKRSIVVEE